MIQKTSDAHLVWRKASTWLALASASSTAGLAAFAILPERAQILFPDWVLIARSTIAVCSALLVPVATSIRQQGLSK